MSEETIRDLVRRLIHAVDQDDMEEEAERLGYEVAGYRLVTGGQEDLGMTRFYDFRTGEQLIEMEDANYEEFEWPIDWAHVDILAPREFRTDRVVGDELPSSLVDALVEWVLNHLNDARDWVESTPDDG